MKTNKLISRDLAHIWHPCSQMKDYEEYPPVPIKSAKGVYLYDYDGKSYIDGISSWWVNLFGHSHPHINATLKKQLKALEHTLLAGFTHKGIIDLSYRLCALLGKPFSKCFYGDNGSSAVEIALKMSFHAHALNGDSHRKYFLALSNAYHGETLGALSVGDVGLYKQTYEPLLLRGIFTPVPRGVWNGKSIECDYSAELARLGEILKKRGKHICAFILEPLLQCAGGMNMYPSGFVKEACEMAQSFGIHIIFDEIAVGFGRVGSLFAFMQCNTKPTFLCLSKGITGGYLPLSVVVTNDEIYDRFYAPFETQKAFLHSHSYTGNALACAAANAVLDIFEKDKIIKKNAILSTHIATHWRDLAKHQCVRNLRVCGMVFAFEVESKRTRICRYIAHKALQRGILLRPLDSTVYFMPPYIITKKQAKFVCEVLLEILDEIKRF